MVRLFICLNFQITKKSKGWVFKTQYFPPTLNPYAPIHTLGENIFLFACDSDIKMMWFLDETMKHTQRWNEKTLSIVKWLYELNGAMWKCAYDFYNIVMHTLFLYFLTPLNVSD